MESQLTSHRLEPFLAFAIFLCALIAASFMIQFIGDILDISLVKYALPIALLPCLALTYGHFFSLSRGNLIAWVVLAKILAILGFASNSLLDFSFDSLDYHQPSINAILNGWNPLHADAALFWQNFHPFGAWSIQASLAALYGSIESAKMLHIWLLFIALPILLAGLQTLYGRLHLQHYALTFLLLLNPVVVMQCQTHYVDAMLYLEGMIFIGAIMMRGDSLRRNQLSALLMAIALLLMINTKLSGIYWGVMACAGALMYFYGTQREFPRKIAGFLFVIGLISTVVFGYHPYVRHMLEYGALMPWSSEQMLGDFIPANIRPLTSAGRLLYSILSVTQDLGMGQDITLKWPWILYKSELSVGNPSRISIGFGPLFALGFLLSVTLCVFYTLKQKRTPHKGLLCLTATILIFCLVFPQSWYVRYAPFTYAVPFLLLFASYPSARRAGAGLYLVLGIFALNSSFTAVATYFSYAASEARFEAAADRLQKAKPRNVYLLSARGAEGLSKNHGYIALQRRLKDRGIDAELRVDGTCPHKVASWIEFDVCYE